MTKQRQERDNTIQDNWNASLKNDEKGLILTDGRNMYGVIHLPDQWRSKSSSQPRIIKWWRLSISHEEMELAVKALKMGKAAGFDNIPAELITNRWETESSRLWSSQQHELNHWISHKVMPTVIMDRKKEAEEIVAEEQVSFCSRRSTMEEIFNVCFLDEKYV